MLYLILGSLFFILGACCAMHALLTKKESTSALGWVVICLVIPGIGSLAYILFGINRIRRRASRLLLRKLKNREETEAYISTPVAHLTPGYSTKELKARKLISYADDDEQQLLATLLSTDKNAPLQIGKFITPHTMPETLLPARMRPFASIGRKTTGVNLVADNNIIPLFNGEEAYPEMLRAIHQAKKSIWLSTYIFDNDSVGKAFITAFAAAKKRGVDVRVLVDGLGTFLTRPSIYKALRKADIAVAKFFPPRLLPPEFFINLRNHRKLLFIDGNLAFTGGMNISATHMTQRKPGKFQSLKNHFFVSVYQDIHFKITGPVLEQFQLMFARDWLFVTGGGALTLNEISYPRGYDSICRTVLNGPDTNAERLESILVGIISAAKQEINIMTPYFLPQRAFISALQSAALRSVKVNVIIPAVNDQPLVKWASLHLLGELLQYGIRVYAQPAPFAHSKLMMVDSFYSHIGSANIDPRSLRLNFELTMEVFDPALTGKLNKHFHEVRRRSTLYTTEMLQKRGLPVRLRDAVSWLFSPYM